MDGDFMEGFNLPTKKIEVECEKAVKKFCEKSGVELGELSLKLMTAVYWEGKKQGLKEGEMDTLDVALICFGEDAKPADTVARLKEKKSAAVKFKQTMDSYPLSEKYGEVQDLLSFCDAGEVDTGEARKAVGEVRRILDGIEEEFARIERGSDKEQKEGERKRRGVHARVARKGHA